MAEETKNTNAGIDLSQLRATLIIHFSEDELRDLAFEMEIDYESLPGDNKNGKARELIIYCQRRNRISELLVACHRLRPDVRITVPAQQRNSEPVAAVQPGQSKPVHQLRNPVLDFIGRAAEIEDLVGALSVATSGTTGATAIIHGLGGLGKTQLANMVGQRLCQEFPDGQVYLELQGVNKSSIPPEQVLQRVIQTFEPQAKVPETLGELQTLYRSTLDGKRVLIIADNAKDEAQVRALEPLSGCALLVTSRQRFGLPGAVVLDLAALPQAEAEALLLKICPRIKSFAPRLAELCGRLPLALRVSASLLQNDVTQNISRYLQALEKERLHYLSDPESPNDPTVSVSASLNLSYTALNDARQRILRQISVFPASFDLAAAKAVISLQGVKAGAGDEREIRAALEAAGLSMAPSTPPVKLRGRAVLPREEDSLGFLYRRSLVEYDTATERYSLHDLVREFAAERLKTTDEWIRYINHYLEVAKQADRLYLQGNEHMLEGLALFDRERVHIDAAWEWLRKQPQEIVIDRLLIDYANAVVYVGSLRYDVRREQIPQLEAGLAAAQRLRRKAAQSAMLGNLGNAYAALGETQRAIELYEQSLVIDRDLGDRRGEGIALGSLGNAYAALGEIQRAIELHQQSLLIARDLSDRRGEGGDLGNLGNAYAALGEIQRAIELYEQSLVIERDLGDRHGEGNVLSNLGNAYAVLGQTQQAIELYNQRLVIARDLGDRRGEGNALGNQGLMFIELGQVAQATSLSHQALEIMREISHRKSEGYALKVLGLAYAAAGEAQQGQLFEEQALEIARTIKDRRLECQVLDALGEALLSQNNLAEAETHFEQALSIAQQLKARQLEAKSSWNLGLVYEQQADLARAVELMQVRVDYEREIGHLKADERAAQLAEVRVRLAAS